MRISDWSSDVCSSDLGVRGLRRFPAAAAAAAAVASAARGVRSLRRTHDGDPDSPPSPARGQLMNANPIPSPSPSSLEALNDWVADRSEEHTSELQSLMRISYAVFCLKKKKTQKEDNHN